MAGLALAATLVVLAAMLFGPFPSLPKDRTATTSVKSTATKPSAEKKKSDAGKPAPQPPSQAQQRPQPQDKPQSPSQAQEDALLLAKALAQAKKLAQSQAGDAVHFEEHLPPQVGQPENGSPGHEMRAKVEPPAPTAPASVVTAPPEPQTHPVAGDAGKNPRMVVVIDDIGDHPTLARNLTELPFPITLAILPDRPRTRSVEAMAVEQGTEVILHQPMQPGSYPRVNPGPGALFVDMDPERIKTTLLENLAQVPHVKGINNHMGSAFTSSPEGMAVVMAVLKEKGLFFLDSVTSAVSAAPEAARKAGVPLYRRAVFLDNVRNVRTILGQLKTAERAAIKNGRAIAIGHPYGETLEALKLWAKERDNRIDVVTLTQLGPEF